MDKRRIQEQRMKGYFIEAAKKVIKEEGVSNLTVKKVAYLAGYAPGTLYNYFTDLNTLLFYCVVDFFDDCKKKLLKEEEENSLKRRVINLAKSYSNYFITNPNIYQLIFLKDLGIPPEEFKKEEGYIPEVVVLLKKNLKECAQKGIIKEKDIEVIGNLIGNCIHGNLLFFINRNNVITKQEVMEKIETEVRYLLEE